MRFRMTTQLYGSEVSTVELPEGYSQSELGSYETMIMGYKGEWLDYQTRCNTLNEAAQDHITAIQFVKDLYEEKSK